ncbi:MAG: hypothetical protein M3N31_02325 [Actinomycetota bacterium]|nr:hypothetical protein [Actinomycetota bacterium]
MPRHSVVNRRNLDPLVRKTVLVSEEALERVSEIGAALRVSQGSLIDTALRHLAASATRGSSSCCASTGI